MTALSHKVIVDNFIDATGYPSLDSNFFKYEYGPWKEPGQPVGSEYPTRPNWNFTTSDAGFLKEFHFSGTGADIVGAVYCIFEGNNTRTPLIYTLHIDGAETSYPEAVRANAGYPLMYTVSGLEDDKHSVRFQDLGVHNCIPEAKGGVILTVDYALVTLGEETQIHPESDLLLAGTDDPFVMYSNDGWTHTPAPWTPSEEHIIGISEFLSMPVTETTTSGSWVAFSFFGSYIAAAGSMNIGTGSCPAPGWCTELSLRVSLDGEVSEHKYPQPDTVRPFFWEANNLSDLPNGAPHVVNITLLDAPLPSGDTFRVAGFAYSPTFTSLAEGEKLWENAPASSDNSSPGPDTSSSNDKGDTPSAAEDSKPAPLTGNEGQESSDDGAKSENSESGTSSQHTSVAMLAVLCISTSMTAILLFA